MPSLRSILSLLALGSVMVENPIPELLIKKAACVIGMIVFSCVMVGALLLAAIIYGYQAMLEHGYSPMQAGLYITGGLFVVSFISVMCSMSSAEKLMGELKGSLKKNVPLTTHLGNEASNLVEAFIAGFMNRPKE